MEAARKFERVGTGGGPKFTSTLFSIVPPPQVMDMSLLLLFVAMLAFVNATSVQNPTDTDRTDTSTDIDDRININVNRGHAVAHGAGGVSVSDSESKGVQVGIRRPGMADQTLYQKTDSRGSAHSYGQRPPTAWTAANNHIANGGIGGGATAGFSGGQGVAQTESMSKTVEIPLDNYGTVLFSNLQEKQHDTHKAPNHKPLNFRPEV